MKSPSEMLTMSPGPSCEAVTQVPIFTGCHSAPQWGADQACSSDATLPELWALGLFPTGLIVQPVRASRNHRNSAGCLGCLILLLVNN